MLYVVIRCCKYNYITTRKTRNMYSPVRETGHGQDVHM